jgi:hypothetical protein
MSYRQAAAECGITTTAAQYAGSLQVKMDELGISDPSVLVTEPPAGTRRIRQREK